jgi:hypothetical protein
MGPYAGVDLSHSQLRYSAIQPYHKGTGVDWGKSLLLVEHICICLLISKTGFYVFMYRKEGGKR